MFIFISVILYRNANKNHVTVLKLLNIDNSTRTSVNSTVVNYVYASFFLCNRWLYICRPTKHLSKVEHIAKYLILS